MGIYLELKCRLCGEEIDRSAKTVMFPNFIADRRSPLFLFNEAVLHASCFHGHPLSERMMACWNELERRNKPESRRCPICGRLASDPEDYFSLGYLTEDAGAFLFEYNYSCFHRSCFHGWARLPDLIRALEALNQCKDSSGFGVLDYTLALLRRCEAGGEGKVIELE